MAERVTAHALRDAIAEVLWAAYKAYEIEAACDSFGMPAVEDAWTYNSKRVYVRNRLAGVPLARMLEIAQRVVDEHPDPALETMLAGGGVRGVDGELKNLIFAADGPKPRIVLVDAINNLIEIREGADRVLVYDRPLGSAGLTWGELLAWWQAAGGTADEREAAKTLYQRLTRSVADSPAEKTLWRTYCWRYGREGAEGVPALIPQVYLHYDPYTRAELKGVEGGELARQRMDFLLLPSQRRRVVIEVDGAHHYSEDGRASPRRYSEMLAEDRRVRLAGYEVFRFGGWELTRPDAEAVVDRFFDELLG